MRESPIRLVQKWHLEMNEMSVEAGSSPMASHMHRLHHIRNGGVAVVLQPAETCLELSHLRD